MVGNCSIKLVRLEVGFFEVAEKPFIGNIHAYVPSTARI